MLAALYTWFAASRDPGFITDFDQIWVAARALIDGVNPYQAVARGYAGHAPLPFPLFYPLPAVIAGIPFAFLPLVGARAAFAALSIGTFAYLLSARGLWALVALLSAPAFMTVSLVQWSGWLACAALVPWFGWAIAAKPNAGLAVLASATSMRSLAISLAMTAAVVGCSFVLQPGWVGDWLMAVRGQPHFRPYVLRPGGVVMLLALLRWRRPEARWMATIACLPGTPGPQEALVFLAWPLTFRQLLVIGLLSHGAMWAAFPSRQYGDFYSYVDAAAIANLVLLYVPMLFILLRKPNEGSVPAWVERVIARSAELRRRRRGHTLP